MKMRYGTGFGAIACSVGVDKKLSLRSEVPCDLVSESVGYAVCRFLTKSALHRRILVRESRNMRFAKKSRPLRHWFAVPAVLVELPGGWVRFHCVVNAQGVTVDRIHLLKCRPGEK